MFDLSVRKAREAYFKQSGLPPDGGYEKKWVPLKFGFLTLYLYNSKSRMQAVRLHDIHHVVTGYNSDPLGEAEISAWELGAGVYRYHFARFINLAGVFYGAYLYPKRTFRAYVFGRNSSSLYNQRFSQTLLDEKLETLKSQLLPKAPPSASLTDYVSYLLLIIISSTPATVLVIFVVWMLSNVA